MPAAYDVVVIGGGPGGYVAAIRAAQLGLRTAVVEREQVGGVCLNWGCIPSKALLRNAEVVNLVRNASDYGIGVDNPSYDMAAAIDRSRRVVDQMTKGVLFLLKKNNIDLVQGCARLDGPNAVLVEPGGDRLDAKAVIVATGARARGLPSLAPDGDRVITSREALELREPPKSIAIVGAGPVGLEFAYFYRAYGVEVTVIEALDRCLPTEDAEVGSGLARELKKLKIAVKTGVPVESAEHDGDVVRLSLGENGSAGVVEAEKVLLGVGITPNSEGLGLEEAGVKLARGGWIEIDDQMRTTASRRLRHRRRHRQAGLGPRRAAHGHRRRRGHRRPRRRAHRLREHAPRHLLPAPGGRLRPHRGAGGGAGLYRPRGEVSLHGKRQGGRLGGDRRFH